MKKSLLALIVLTSIAAVQATPVPMAQEKVPFREVWGYLMKGEEKNLRGSEPFTDICYFSAAVSGTGKLAGDAAPPAVALGRDRKVRFHLVISELSNYSLMHFVLNPALPVRAALIEDIAKASIKYDGVQIDFECVFPSDAPWFHGFLRDLKKRLPDKILSVAVPARRTRAADAYEYPVIAGIADRVVVMAYDQHWSTSRPGPVASKSWAAEVARNALEHIPRGKLIMGLPLYGRAWQERRHDRALRHSHVEEILGRHKLTPKEDEENGMSFEYDESVRVIAYFESVNSILVKLRLYASLGVDSVSFWRIGQENAELWNRITAQ
jgi:spore germination protein YaaH